ncbi:MAG: prepilin peptidase [Nitrososphaerales archaeon]
MAGKKLILQLVTASFMLLLVSFLDLRYREIPDKIWIPFGSLGIVFILIDAISQNGSFSPFLIALSVGLTGVIAFGIYYLGFYGGADAKALLTLSIIIPLYSSESSFHPFTSLATLSNSLLLTLSVPIFMFIRNAFSLARGNKIFLGFEEERFISKIIVMFLGFRARKANGFVFGLEKEMNGRKKFDLAINRMDDEYARGSDLWVTPGLPLLVFITLGFFSLFVVGDLIFLIIRLLLT